MTDCWSRRRLLSVAGSVALAATAGCGAVDSWSRSPVPVEIANFTAEEQYLDLVVVREGAEDLSNSTVLRESYRLDASGEGEEEYTLPEPPTVPNRPCTVRGELSGASTPPRHYHYVPDCVGVDSHDDRLYVAVTSGANGPTVTFDQNGCR